MNSKLAGITMSKFSFEGVVALKRAGLVSTFPTVYSARLQENVDSICYSPHHAKLQTPFKCGKHRFCEIKTQTLYFLG